MNLLRALLLLPFTLLLAAPAHGAGNPAADLESGFRFPPNEARPRALWMWMNGNVTVDGIARDLQAMQRVGLGGALIFNIGEFIPKGPVDYGSSNWIELVTIAAREADRLGLELAMHNCPGWSSSGGPWITPEMSMQRLVWSETRVTGGTNLQLTLPQPFTRQEFYRDIRVLAFPTLPGEERPFGEALAAVRNTRGSVDKRLLTDTDLASAVSASPDNPLVLEFAEPFSARAVTILYTSGGGTVGFDLESSTNGETFTRVAQLRPATPRAIEDASLVASFDPVEARFFRITPLRARGITELELHGSMRIPDWNFKANHVYRAARPFAVATNVPAEFVIDRSRILDVSQHMTADGVLRWNAPTGDWTLVRFGHTARGQENIAAPDSGVGLEVDKMSRAALLFHFDRGIGPLLRALGPLAGRSFRALEIDSHEVGVQNWTSGFEEMFRERNGYELIHFLPTMTGRYVQGAEITEQFLWDLRRTHAELVADNYFGALRELANAHGLRLLAEPYGAGPGAYDELQIAGRVDIPMGEFWAHFPWDDMMSLRLAASAAHVHGRSLVAGEAFTSTEEQSRFLDYPFGLKTTGDLAFSMGLNQMYFHRYAHQPHPTAVPGMTMGPWGFNYDRNNPWFEASRPWITYLSRCQFLLQQGNFVADVLYFTGEGSPQMSRRIVPSLPPGYQFDAIDAEALLRHARVEDREIVLETGGRYRMLAMPSDLNAMTPQVLRKVRELVRAGAVLAGPRPRLQPSLRDPATAGSFTEQVNELWGTNGGGGFGDGKVFATQNLGQVLREIGVAPDFDYTPERPDADLVWLHRRDRGADIYFVANRQRRSENVVLSFRVTGREPELWHPETGTIKPAALYSVAEGRTRVGLTLKPAESLFVVFRRPARTAVTSVSRNGTRLIDVESASWPQGAAGSNAVTPITNTFSAHVWIKPDTDLMAFPQEGGVVQENGKSWVIAAPPAVRSASAPKLIGVAAGRNGVIVAQRSFQSLNALLVYRGGLSGWTHLALVVRDGTPTLYLNGRKVAEGRGAEPPIRLGGGMAPPPGTWIYHFDGDLTSPQWVRGTLSEAAILDIVRRGVPDPQITSGVEITRDGDRFAAQSWSAGLFRLDTGAEFNVLHVPEPVVVAGPWDVSFSGREAPPAIVLTNLGSLHEHSDAAVRGFSGTATYRTQFDAPVDRVHGGRVWLDLGRVAVIAEVRLNGEWLDTLWRPPYRIDITDHLLRRGNDLEIRVSTLLANRMISDEALPPENEYDSSTRAIVRFPEWYRKGEREPEGGRATFSSWRFFEATDPLVESGLRGPVRLVTSVQGHFR